MRLLAERDELTLHEVVSVGGIGDVTAPLVAWAVESVPLEGRGSAPQLAGQGHQLDDLLLGGGGSIGDHNAQAV